MRGGRGHAQVREGGGGVRAGLCQRLLHPCTGAVAYEASWAAVLAGLARAPHFPGSLFCLFCHLKEQVLRAEVWLIYPQKQVCLPSPVSVEAVGGPEGRGSWGGRASGRPPSPGDCVQAGPRTHHPGVPGRLGSAEAGQAPDWGEEPRVHWTVEGLSQGRYQPVLGASQGWGTEGQGDSGTVGISAPKLLPAPAPLPEASATAWESGQDRVG